MTTQLLGHTRYRQAEAGWNLPELPAPGLEADGGGLKVSASSDETITVRGEGVHTRNGDSIELRFRRIGDDAGALHFGFDADLHEYARVELNFGKDTVALYTTEWTAVQPVASAPLSTSVGKSHVLRLEKRQGRGNLVKNADIRVYFDGEQVLAADDLNVLPEMGVDVKVRGTAIVLEEFIHRGAPSGMPEYLHLGGWQVLNVESIEANLDSICRGLALAAQEGVELLVTPETSLTGLFARSHVTNDPDAAAAAEQKLRRFIHDLPDAPYLIAGLPVWESVPEHDIDPTRYNVCRLYDPDGEIVSTHAKVHSAEPDFWHGYRLNEFEVNGVPMSLHICHDHRYPELSTLPVMFGARLVIHPSNGGSAPTESVDAFEESAKSDSRTSHAFHIKVNGAGGSFIVGPRRDADVLDVSPEGRRDNAAFPMVGPAEEGLLHARIRIPDAFGYWPVRSFRASEAVAEAYLALYQTLGGSRGIEA